MTLRRRLLFSYVLLVLLTLAVMTLALVLFLLAQPVPSNVTYERLAGVTREILDATELGDNRPALGELRRILNQAESAAAENNVRVLLVNLQRNTIIGDSAGTYLRGDAFNPQLEAFTLSNRLTQRLVVRGEPIFGSLRDPDGALWQFAGLAFVLGGQERQALLVADQPERQTAAMVWQRLRFELARPLAQAALIGLVVAALLAAAISRGFARSLARLAQGAQAVAAGRYDEPVPETGPAEVRAAAAAFNEMSHQVQSAQRAQADFVANVSHDLKTPLTSIRGYSQAIFDGAAKDPAAAARIIHEEAGRLNRLVTELTDLERLQSGQFSMHIQPLDLAALAGAVAERLRIMAEEKGLTLHVQTAPTPPVAGDGDRLAQVLTNLLSNAIKYTPGGGSVWLRAEPHHGGVEVMVRDTGQGIPADELGRVFERFYQVDKARGPRRGAGLGLAITQQIVLAHGGQITASSAGPGQGSTFTVWLPAPQVPSVTKGR